MANRKLKKCPVNAALSAMRKKDLNFEIKEFLDHTGVSREDLFYHKKNPNAKWIKRIARDMMQIYFSQMFDSRVIADHDNMRMIKAKKDKKSNENI